MGCVPWCQTIFTLFSSSGGAGWAISNLTGVSFRKMCNFRDLDLSRPELTERGYLLLRAAAALQNRNRRQNHEDSGISCVFASSLSLHFWLCSWVLHCCCPGPFGFQNRSRQQSHEDLGISCRLRPSPYCPNFRTVWNCSADSDRVQVEGKLFFLFLYNSNSKISLHSLRQVEGCWWNCISK